MSQAALRITNERQSLWVALALTEGLGPTRACRLVERFGTIEGVFRASLTELEAAEIQAVSAQSLGTGRSLAQEEVAKARTAGVEIVTIDDASYPARLRGIYDPPLLFYVRGRSMCPLNQELPLSEPGIRLPAVQAWQNGWPAIWLIMAW